MRQQSAGALLGDLGITSGLFSDPECTASEADCSDAPSGGSPEIADETLDRVELYGMLLGVPVRERWDDDRTLQGKTLFTAMGCATCHVERHTTGSIESFPELTEQTIYPYTDLLLHDLGDELGDGRPSFDAEGNEWRTPPLWGLRLLRGGQRARPAAARRPRARRGRGDPLARRRGRAREGSVPQPEPRRARAPRRFRGVAVKRRACVVGALGLGGAAILRGALACGPTEISDRRRELLTSYGEAFLLADYAEFEARCAELAAKARAVAEEPSETTLEEARDAWFVARAPWKRTEVFAFGPYSEEPQRFGPKIDFWPARPETVDETLAGDDELDADSADRLGAPAKGSTRSSTCSSSPEQTSSKRSRRTRAAESTPSPWRTT